MANAWGSMTDRQRTRIPEARHLRLWHAGAPKRREAGLNNRNSNRTSTASHPPEVDNIETAATHRLQTTMYGMPPMRPKQPTGEPQPSRMRQAILAAGSMLSMAPDSSGPQTERTVSGSRVHVSMSDRCGCNVSGG